MQQMVNVSVHQGIQAIIAMPLVRMGHTGQIVLMCVIVSMAGFVNQCMACVNAWLGIGVSTVNILAQVN